VISDAAVKRLFQDTWRIQSKYYDYRKPIFTQLFRGEDALSWPGQHSGGCKTHLKVFDEKNIIPSYCFSCYKIQIEPRNVVELFKLMMIFDTIQLPHNNTRKCMTENRPDVKGFYKGLIYARSKSDADEIARRVQQQIDDQIADGIPVNLKRGCSEYGMRFPEYKLIEPEEQTMQYNPAWAPVEKIAYASIPAPVIDPKPDDPPPGSYTAKDAMAMMGWLKYAATIGDDSYLKVCWRLQPFSNVDRPEPFMPAPDK
jgi:hypothetical protein